MTVKVDAIDLGAAKAFVLHGERGVVLVDTGTPQSVPKLTQRLRELVPDPKAVRLILLTHGHTDHIGGAKALAELTGAPLAMHGSDAELAAGVSRRAIPRTWLGHLTAPLVNRMALPPACRFRPEIILTADGLDLRQYGVAADVVHTPGHTAGSLSLLVEGGVAIVADIVMPAIPLMSRPGLPLYAGDLDVLRQSLKRVLAWKPATILCSHGGPYTPAAVAKALGVG